MKKSTFIIALALGLMGGSVTNVYAAETPVCSTEAKAYDNPYEWLSTYRLKSADLQEYSLSDLRLMRNAIYAMHGYIFKNAEMRAHFSDFEWYYPQYNNVDSKLSAIENANVKTIQNRENELKKTGKSAASASVNQANPFLFLSKSKLTASEVEAEDKGQLAIWRNAIYAKHGYIFKNASLKKYFSKFSWYTPKSDNVESQLTAIERANVKLILDAEKKKK